MKNKRFIRVKVRDSKYLAYMLSAIVSFVSFTYLGGRVLGLSSLGQYAGFWALCFGVIVVGFFVVAVSCYSDWVNSLKDEYYVEIISKGDVRLKEVEE